MAKGSGKAKGGGFERLVSKRLSLWVSGGKDEDLFWRSALSGGRATVALKKGQTLKRQSGDISSVGEGGHVLTNFWYLECKFYANLDILNFIFLGRGKLQKFWKTALKEAKRYDKLPMLIAKQNRFPIIVVVKADTLNDVLEGTPNIICVRRYKMNVDIYLFEDVMSLPFVIEKEDDDE